MKKTQNKYLFDFATEDDFNKCRNIVISHIKDKLTDKQYDDITTKVMKTAYSIGGGYHYTIIASITDELFNNKNAA